MNFLRDTTVLVLGLGDSGLAMARWCVRHGAKVSVWDSRQVAPQDEVLAAELSGVQRLHSLPLPPRERAGVRVNGAPTEAVVFGDDGTEPALSAAAFHPHPNPLPEREREPFNYTLILKSPGLAPGDERIAPLLAQARATGVAVLGELDLFVHALADLKTQRAYAPQVLAITGTNGKTTVTAMTALLVERAGKTVAVAGNIGPTLLDTLQAQMDAVPWALAAPAAPVVENEVTESTAAVEQGENDATDDDAEAAPQLPQVWVLELSSFQLEGGGAGVLGFEPAAAAVLNVTQDHLDWHGSMAAYTQAKARVFGQQAVMVINRDDATVLAMVPTPTVGKLGKGQVKVLPREVCAFSLQTPQRPGDFGLVEEGGMAWLVRALPADETIKRKKGEPEEDIHLQRLMPADALRVRGRHNAANALAALALATTIGCALAPMLHGLRDYRGEPHRVQFVARVGDVDAYDDSKGTNVGATVAALNGLGADTAPGRLLLILGGDGKGQDFTPLLQPLVRHARAVALIGSDARHLLDALNADPAAAALPRQHIECMELAAMDQAVAWCFAQAQPGDAVLLSPACASLDMFKNYAHRALVFVAAVQALAADRGQA